MRVGERARPIGAERRLALADQDRRAIDEQAVDQVGGEEGGGGLGAALDEQIVDVVERADRPAGCRAASSLRRRRRVVSSGAARRAILEPREPHIEPRRVGLDRCRVRPGSCRLRARSRWPWARASSPVIHWLSPEAVAIMPSIDMASFSVTKGRPSRIAGEEAGHRARRLLRRRRRCRPRFRPLSAGRSRRRRCADRDRPAPITTRAGRAATSKSAQAGPRALAWAQGSSVT